MECAFSTRSTKLFRAPFTMSNTPISEGYIWIIINELQCPRAMFRTASFNIIYRISQIFHTQTIILTCPLGAILLWVRIWVKGFSADSQNFTLNFSTHKMQEKVLKPCDFRTFYGCGRRTRTSDLRVMSPTSFQLLYPAIWGALPKCWDIVTQKCRLVKGYFL